MTSFFSVFVKVDAPCMTMIYKASETQESFLSSVFVKISKVTLGFLCILSLHTLVLEI